MVGVEPNNQLAPEITIRLAVDGMGGDNAPGVVVEGVLNYISQAQKMGFNDFRIYLVGDPWVLEEMLKENKQAAEVVEIVAAPQAIPMDAHPKEALQQYPDNSMVKAAQLVANGQADAMISAGNTGALVLAAARHIPRITGVHRTALAAVYPTRNELGREDIFALALDVGANVFVEAEHLVHFALMGAAYASEVKKIPQPAVALLNMGTEDTKGGERYVQAYQILSALPDLNFIGNIEGSDLMRGIADVVVTEGFIGNVALKTLEGAAETLMGLGKYAFKEKFLWKLGLIMLSGGIRSLKKLTDYQEYGGAPILGLQKLVLKCHGKSTARAIANAIKLAAKAVRDDLMGMITRSIQEFEVTFSQPDFANNVVKNS